MDEELGSLKTRLLEEISKATDGKVLNELYLDVFGQNGKFLALTRKLKDLPKEEKPKIGKLLNEIKTELAEAFEKQKNTISQAKLSDWLDVTAPGDAAESGHLHIVSEAISEITRIFERIGFTSARYPEVEWDWYAFSSLNFPPDHPARDDFETFFIDSPPHPKFGKLLLSPHTSSGQVREMERAGKPPIRMINIAKCYRPNWDITHTPMFHQFEGMVIDKGINITHLKGTFEYFAKEYFGKDRKIRLRPHHFQFTEPSFEVDITCGTCNMKGCRLCKGGWMELCGSGMIHPNVLRAGKIDPKIYTGYAFGWGVERSFMMKQGIQIDDMRLLYSNDIRFLEQF